MTYLLIDSVWTGGGTRLSNYAVDANATDCISISQLSANKAKCLMYSRYPQLAKVHIGNAIRHISWNIETDFQMIK